MPVSPAKFVHVVYRTHNYEKMLEWYGTVFGARVQYRDPMIAFMTYDDEHHRIAFVNLGAVRPDGAGKDGRGMVGVDHVAYTHASLNDLFENYAELKAKGITPYWCVHHGITVSMYYADPDGNQMEFQVDAFDTADEANALMHSPRWPANPIGIEYDPDDWLARLRAGTPAAMFLAREGDLPVSPIRGALEG